MIPTLPYRAALFFFLLQPILRAQSLFPFNEKFDTVAAPKLPAGWLTSRNKSSSGDFSTSTSSPFSGPNAVVSSDAKISQTLISPPVDFTGKIAGTLQFYERRTSSHNSGLCINAMLDEDTASAVGIGDTLRNAGTTNYVLRTLLLPSVLSGKRDVRFRWHVVGDGSGATGTLRIDNVTVTVQKKIDLAITGLTCTPSRARVGDPVVVRATVANKALAGTLSFTLQLFDESNSDSLILPAAKVDERGTKQFFNAGDSVLCTFVGSAFSPGNRRIFIRLLLEGDEDSTNNTMSKVMSIGYPLRTMLINEIMFAPFRGPEWIECVNNSADTISPSGWKIGDNTLSRAAIRSQATGIAPGALFVIAKDSSLRGAYPSIRAPIMTSDFPTLNNDFDAVVVCDPAGFAVDSVAYSSSWGGTAGRSLERIDTAGDSNQQTNWGSSCDPLGATPGAVNSLTKKEYDAAIAEFFPSTPFPVARESFELEAVVKNCGRQVLSNIAVKFFIDANKDSIPQPNELIGEEFVGSLAPADSQTVSHALLIDSQGDERSLVTVTAQQDDDSTNNTLSTRFSVGVERHSIVINEIMYAPPDNMPEWIEFYNGSAQAIDMNGWKVSNSNIRSKAVLAASSFIVRPGEYFLASSDSTVRNYFTVTGPICVTPFSSLKNTAPDAVVLYDDRGVTMDSVWYKPSWGGANGKTLERVDYLASSVDSSNWKSSPPTPGAENISAKKNYDLAVSSASGVSANGGFDLTAIIRNIGRNAANGFAVRFYHDANGDSIASSGELIGTANYSSLAAGDSLPVRCAWRTQVRGIVPVICSVDFSLDQRSSNNSLIFQTTAAFEPQSVVINEIMYDPLPGRSEFVELFNRSVDTVDLHGWSMMDAPSGSGNRAVVNISNRPLLLSPNNYLVIGADSSMILQFSSFLPPGSSNLIIANKDLSLNNSGDDVILLDETKAQIDSVRYSPSWHNPMLNTSTSGKSLERINPSLASNNRNNWSTSIAPEGGTPGERNSIFTASIPSAAGLTLSPNPFSPDNDGFQDYLAIGYSLPAATSMIRVRCFDVQGRLVRTLANNEPAAASGTLLWNGLDDNNKRVRVGMYIILFEALDAGGGVVHVMKDVAVVATKL
ncbi:MAG TPA: lamin tail domain-containing protein [Bacteroidota bacterium]|nr:lamin tail domain-containing protein [Bacteroidota bacterium]